jgi:hypothetical protein
MTKYAPIILFAFNRPDAIRRTVESLKRNTEASESDLFVFVDGPRESCPSDVDNVHRVKEYVNTITGFSNVERKFSETNRGLALSVITGVSDVINRYGRAIVLEDDLILSDNCLSFLNQGLDMYEEKHEVFSVCAYTNKVNIPKNYNDDAYFCVRSSSWGWATWADRWNSVDWELNDWAKYVGMKDAFNKWGGSDCFGMLQGWRNGLNKSWAIRFCFAQFLQQKLSLFPVISKISNEGFDGEGTNCKKYNRFKCVFDKTSNKTFIFPVGVVLNSQLYKSALSYHSIPKRIWSKIMYLICR